MDREDDLITRLMEDTYKNSESREGLENAEGLSDYFLSRLEGESDLDTDSLIENVAKELNLHYGTFQRFAGFIRLTFGENIIDVPRSMEVFKVSDVYDSVAFNKISQPEFAQALSLLCGRDVESMVLITYKDENYFFFLSEGDLFIKKRLLSYFEEKTHHQRLGRSA